MAAGQSVGAPGWGKEEEEEEEAVGEARGDNV
jgi:hypothetical protein